MRNRILVGLIWALLALPRPLSAATSKLPGETPTPGGGATPAIAPKTAPADELLSVSQISVGVPLTGDGPLQTGQVTAAPGQPPANVSILSEVPAGAAGTVATFDVSAAVNPPRETAPAAEDSLQTVGGRLNHLRADFNVLESAFGLKSKSGAGRGHGDAARVLAGLDEDLRRMAEEVERDPGIAADRRSRIYRIYETVLAHSADFLSHMAEKVDSGQADPYNFRMRLDENAPIYDHTERPLTIVWNGLAGNPPGVHHFLNPLNIQAHFGADKTIWLPAGDDPRKAHILLPADLRYPLNRVVTDLFEPFFQFSDFARGKAFDAETLLFMAFALNPNQRIIAYYLFGDDHYWDINPKNGKPDTLVKLAANMAAPPAGYNPAIHKVIPVVIRRELEKIPQPGHPRYVKTDLPLVWMDHVGFESSSSAIRDGGDYWLMLYATYIKALAQGLYGLKPPSSGG